MTKAVPDRTLDRALAVLRSGRDVPAATAAELADMIATAVDNPPSARAAVGERDRWLVVARTMHLPAGMSGRNAAAVLAREIGRYAATAWPRERALPDCPARHRATIRECVWRALHAHERIPSERHLRRILAGAGGPKNSAEMAHLDRHGDHNERGGPDGL